MGAMSQVNKIYGIEREHFHVCAHPEILNLQFNFLTVPSVFDIVANYSTIKEKQ